MIRFFKNYHKWIGLFLGFFLILSAFSGIILNHRKAFSGVDIPRSLLPASYEYDSWNNGAVKGSIRLDGDSVLLYGGAGIWLTDTLHSHFSDFNVGLKKGADNRITNQIVCTNDGKSFAVTTFDLYRLSHENRWENLTTKAGINERISDLAVRGDSLVVLTRSQVYASVAPFETFSKIELAEPAGYSSEATLFRTLWLLHSGELFGLPGKLVVDLVGVLVIVLCATGIIYTLCPGIIRRRKKKGLPAKTMVDTMKTAVRWHNRIGATGILFFIIIAVSGMFLRPPLLIAIIRSQVKPVPGSVLNCENPWHDKLRCLRYDSTHNEWLLYASSGFFSLKELDAVPKRIQGTPPVSVMGVTVLEPLPEGWLVGSFSGLYHWNRQTGRIIDCYKGTPVVGQPTQGRPVFDHQISGYSGDFHKKNVVFEYDEGAKTFDMEEFAPMPLQIKKGRISLWHTCLEIHVGRAYRPFIGPFSDLFVFLLGLFTTFILISGYVVYRKRHNKSK